MTKTTTKKSEKGESKQLNIYEKLAKAREVIKNSDLEKKGRNEYSKYDYFTPEQVEDLVSTACSKTGTICLCNLKIDQYGYYQTLDFVDVKNPENKISFELRTEKGAITATSDTQQMGGTDTYSERYIKMKVFQIKDNNLDFDSKDTRPKDKSESKKGRTVDDELDNL